MKDMMKDVIDQGMNCVQTSSDKKHTRFCGQKEPYLPQTLIKKYFQNFKINNYSDDEITGD